MLTISISNYVIIRPDDGDVNVGEDVKMNVVSMIDHDDGNDGDGDDVGGTGGDVDD